jgi:integrase
LFTAPGGGFLRYSNWVRRSWYPAAVAAGVGRMAEDEESGRERYEGLSFHDLRGANATGLVAEGVDVKTAQTMLGHSEARLTLDVYAQAVAKLGEAAAEAMGRPVPRPVGARWTRDAVGFGWGTGLTGRWRDGR